jgi:hypothetical protein
MPYRNPPISRAFHLPFLALLLAGLACGGVSINPNNPAQPPAVTSTSMRSVPQEGRWGIYTLDLTTQDIQLVYSSSRAIQTSALRLNNQGDTLVFAQIIDGENNEHSEICTVRVDGGEFKRLTNDTY